MRINLVPFGPFFCLLSCLFCVLCKFLSYTQSPIFGVKASPVGNTKMSMSTVNASKRVSIWRPMQIFYTFKDIHNFSASNTLPTFPLINQSVQPPEHVWEGLFNHLPSSPSPPSLENYSFHHPEHGQGGSKLSKKSIDIYMFCV